MNPEIILPCPFCSTEPLLQEFPAHEHVFATFMPDHEGSWAIECPGCGVGVCTDTRENAIAIWNRRPQADWSAAAREIFENLWGDDGCRKPFGKSRQDIQEKLTAIIIRHAQSQPSAPRELNKTEREIMDRALRASSEKVHAGRLAPSSPVPSQEPVKPSVADGFTAIPINPPDRIVSLMRDKFSDMSKIGDNAVWQVQGWGWMSELYRLIVACERAEASHE